MSPDGIPSNLSANDLRRIADQLEALNLNLVSYIELERQKATGEIEKKGYHGKRKDPQIWIACSKEVVRLLETKAFVGWDDIKENPLCRDSDKGNMTRVHQWQWYLRQHAIPRTPDYGADIRLAGLGKEDKNGPLAVTCEGNLHCAKRAFEGTEYNQYNAFDAKCGFFIDKKKREDTKRVSGAKERLAAANEFLADPTLDPKRRERFEQQRRLAEMDLQLASR